MYTIHVTICYSVQYRAPLPGPWSATYTVGDLPEARGVCLIVCALNPGRAPVNSTGHLLMRKGAMTAVPGVWSTGYLCPVEVFWYLYQV